MGGCLWTMISYILENRVCSIRNESSINEGWNRGKGREWYEECEKTLTEMWKKRIIKKLDGWLIFVCVGKGGNIKLWWQMGIFGGNTNAVHFAIQKFSALILFVDFHVVINIVSFSFFGIWDYFSYSKKFSLPNSCASITNCIIFSE